MNNKASKSIENIMALARNEALKSIMYYKHGAVIFKGKEIISTGFNYDFGQQIRHGKFSVHAEADAILNAIKTKKNIKGASMVVVRVAWKRNNVYGNSKPCKSCTEFINKNELGPVFYTTDSCQFSYNTY